MKKTIALLVIFSVCLLTSCKNDPVLVQKKIVRTTPNPDGTVTYETDDGILFIGKHNPRGDNCLEGSPAGYCCAVSSNVVQCWEK